MDQVSVHKLETNADMLERRKKISLLSAAAATLRLASSFALPGLYAFTLSLAGPKYMILSVAVFV